MTNLSNVTIGASFSPEESEYKDLNRTQIIEALKVIHQTFGIKDIRLGIRWNKAVDAEGGLDLSYYKPFLDYCLKNNVSLTLNIGPIKTFRWPEDHVPQTVLEKLSHTLQKGQTIKMQSELAKQAVAYLKELLNTLENSYSNEELKNIVMIQPENEAFKGFVLGVV